ncbi:hypothetical protein LZQ00_13830 [Sphingobacterium sp. SRCM116780]|uniref:hypothetical protein n=1 Tax=Sphingobacterium sp. SRCM116780 TaxID=2907623 RepID=UPI001F2062CB|nr:hypothetical protein [Sphingobacterium sp. SRCM116780]UIR55345.1 hypothetical protein LZQ00_13830 [Sphingobacterium sp. SRCM116780]
MKIMNFPTKIVTVVAMLAVFGVSPIAAQQTHPEKVVKKTAQAVKPLAPVKRAHVVKDSISQKKTTDMKVKSVAPKAKSATK